MTDPYRTSPPAGRPRWARKRVTVPVAALLLFIGVGIGTAGGEDSGAEAKPKPGPTVTTTATVTASASPAARAKAEPRPTVTVTATATATATETVTAEPAEVAAEPDDVPGGTGGGSVYYSNCTEARAAGDTPLYVGDPGYASHLDRDGDGDACE
ncbi:hypothetical protein GCM10027168_40770 [Streptomyces capparidis]